MIPVIPVATGVLRRADGRVLIAQRPPGKIAAGLWEFPGGKLEAGETPHAGLERELHEELGIEIGTARPLIKLVHAYSDRTVELDTWLVESWQGEPRALEEQALAWVAPEELHDWELLAADGPIVDALCLPGELPVTGAFADTAALKAALGRLVDAGHELIRLRAPELDNSAYRRCLEAVGPALAARGAGLLIDREPDWCALPGVAGWQFTRRHGALPSSRPVPQSAWYFASVHDRDSALAAEAAGVDALLLGAVQPTPSHPGETALGWEAATQIIDAVNRPVYLIGGLAPGEDLASAQAAGAQGIAAIRAYWSA